MHARYDARLAELLTRAGLPSTPETEHHRIFVKTGNALKMVATSLGTGDVTTEGCLATVSYPEDEPADLHILEVRLPGGDRSHVDISGLVKLITGADEDEDTTFPVRPPAPPPRPQPPGNAGPVVDIKTYWSPVARNVLLARLITEAGLPAAPNVRRPGRGCANVLAEAGGNTVALIDDLSHAKSWLSASRARGLPGGALAFNWFTLEIDQPLCEINVRGRDGNWVAVDIPGLVKLIEAEAAAKEPTGGGAAPRPPSPPEPPPLSQAAADWPPGRGEIRDAQRSRVYEWHADMFPRGGEKVLSREEIETLIAKICADYGVAQVPVVWNNRLKVSSQFIRRPLRPEKGDPEMVMSDYSSQRKCSVAIEVADNDWHRRASVVIHEAAHYLCAATYGLGRVESHGPEFASILAGLLSYYHEDPPLRVREEILAKNIRLSD